MSQGIGIYTHLYGLAVQAGFNGDAVECLTAIREIRVRSPSGSDPKIFFFTCHKYTLIQSYKRTFSISYFLVCADDIEMIFCLNLCIYMDKSLVVFWKSFLVLLCFLVKNAKNNIFEDKCFLSKMFHQIKMQAATYWSSHLKKTSNISNFSND